MKYSTAFNLFIVGFSMIIFSSCSEEKKNLIQTTIKHKTEPMENKNPNNETGNLGALSLSLNVKDLKSSKEFYEKLGFSSFGGDMKMNYLIMKNGNSLIGLFQGMFEENIITFNPGWDENANEIEDFKDVRSIQSDLKSKGITPTLEADTTSSGPASMMITDPDGNVILLDQHL